MAANALLRQALAQLKKERARIERQITALLILVGSRRGVRKARRARSRRQGMTAKQRKDVSRRMKAYWAKRRASKA